LSDEPPRNVWIGVSAEDQERYDLRMAHAWSIAAHVHFVSAEPLLGPITMGSLRPDWIIVGGESGPGSREIKPDWVRAIRDECITNGALPAFFFKQWGGTDKKAAGKLLDGRIHNNLPLPF
jgi:protein gp37